MLCNRCTFFISPLSSNVKTHSDLIPLHLCRNIPSPWLFLYVLPCPAQCLTELMMAWSEFIYFTWLSDSFDAQTNAMVGKHKQVLTPQQAAAPVISRCPGEHTWAHQAVPIFPWVLWMLPRLSLEAPWFGVCFCLALCTSPSHSSSQATFLTHLLSVRAAQRGRQRGSEILWVWGR